MGELFMEENETLGESPATLPALLGGRSRRFGVARVAFEGGFLAVENSIFSLTF